MHELRFSKRQLDGDWYEIRLVLKQAALRDGPDAEVTGDTARRKWMEFTMWGASGIAEALRMPTLAQDCAAIAQAIKRGRL